LPNSPAETFPYSKDFRESQSSCTRERTKLRHAAALALVGWYLMLAPPYQDSSGHVGPDYGAPLSKWINLRAFETADQCEAYKPIARKSLKSQIDAQSNKPTDYWPEVFSSFATTQCVATDDPRLAK
jgi:hypothetical protein